MPIQRSPLDTQVAFYPSGVLLPLGLLITGWSVENRVHWIWADVVSMIEFKNSISLIFESDGAGFSLRWSGGCTRLPKHSDVRY